MNGPQDQQGQSTNPWAPPTAPADAPAAPTGAPQPMETPAIRPTLPPVGSPTAPPGSAPTMPAAPLGAPTMPLGTPTRLPGPDVPAAEVTVGGGDGPSEGRTRGKATVIGAIVGVTALVAAGAFAVVKITGNDTDGGAASPTDVGTSLTTALDNEDFLGVIDLLLPGERDTFREPMIEFVDHLSRLEILSDDADLSKIGGLDIQFTDVSVREEPTNVADISNIYLSGSSTVSVDGDAVPIGDLLIDEVFDGDRPDMDAEPESAEFEDTRLTVVERDGRWYLSAFYSVAEQARSDADRDIPETGVEPAGADSPEGALDQLFDAVSTLDLEDMIATLDPSEAEALQRYAPLFLDEAQSELDDLGIDWSISDTAYTVTGDGSRRSVAVDALTFDATISDLGTVHAELADGCVTASADLDGETEEITWCTDDATDSVFEGMGIGDDEAATRLFEVLDEALADYEPGGVAVHQVDGAWYVSPMRSYFDIFNDLLGALDADELRDIVDAGSDFFDSLVDDFGDPFSESLDLPLELPLDESADPMDDGTDDTVFELPTDSGDGSMDDGSMDAYSACFAELDAAAGVACLNAGVDAGTIDPMFVPPHFRFTECGVAEAYWSDIYSMTDAEFVALVEGASPCFLDLVASGRAEAWEVASELLAPQCLEGKNWYTTFEEDYNDRFYECTAKVRDSL